MIYKGRAEGMNPEKEEFANDTDRRSLGEALDGADVFVGVSVKDALQPEQPQNSLTPRAEDRMVWG